MMKRDLGQTGHGGKSPARLRVMSPIPKQCCPVSATDVA
jgi:hypothetical protein